MAKKKAAKGGAKKSNEILIVGSKMKDAIRSNDCNVSSDVIEALNERVHALIADAVKRCQANGRKTVRGTDF
jgi:histone H3/H4